MHKAVTGERHRTSDFADFGRASVLGGVTIVRGCARAVPIETCQAEGLSDKCVDVEIRSYTIDLDPMNIGLNTLPIPRSSKFTFLSQVPRALRILNPRFGLADDKKIGVMPSFEISTDLTALPKLVESGIAESRKTSLLLKAKGGKSLNQRYYTSQAQLSLLFTQPNEQIESVGLDTSFATDSLPQQDARYLKSSFKFGGHVAFNPALGVLNRVILNAAYRKSSNRLYGAKAAQTILTSEQGFEARALLEGRVLNGFGRFALWLDRASPESTSKSYHRVVGLFGYEKELPVGEHSIGIEALFGWGRASSQTPEYARFYGGNSLGSFLYEDSDDPILSSMPSGPILRSFGTNQIAPLDSGSQRGATTFQHLSVTVSVPIPPLSYPLIPNEVVDVDQQGNVLTLRTLIKNFAVDSGQDALSVYFQDEGLTEEEADRKAAKVFREIRPGVNYLTDYAKVFAVKPLFMFDEGRLGRFGAPSNQTRYAVGGGLQFVVVIAKFELGYMRTTTHITGESGGNFIARLVFQNLF